MVPALVDVWQTGQDWIGNVSPPVLLSFMHINEPTCFVLACFQVPSLAPDCFFSRHEASARFSGSFPSGVSLSELYLPVINIITRSRFCCHMSSDKNHSSMECIFGRPYNLNHAVKIHVILFLFSICAYSELWVEDIHMLSPLHSGCYSCAVSEVHIRDSSAVSGAYFWIDKYFI